MKLLPLLRNIFPQGTVSEMNQRELRFEVKLPENVEVTNCEILQRAVDVKGPQKEHFLVRAGNYVMHFCIRPNYDSETKPKEAVSLACAPLDDDEAVAELQARAYEQMGLAYA